MPFRLVSADGQLSFELRAGAPLVLGRALSSDLPVLDPTVSRRHAELTIEPSSVLLRDLGSSNGTFVNGSRVSTTSLIAGDHVVFGKILFELHDLSPLLIDDSTAETKRRAARAGTTVIRQVPVPDADLTLERALRASGVHPAVDETALVLPQHERDRLKLTLLLEVSKALTRVTSVDALLDKMLDFTFRLVEVDQASILLLNEDAVLAPRLTRVRPGATTHEVPVGLAQSSLEQKSALLSDNTDDADDGRAARSSVCAPLMGGEGRALGVLYVDSLASKRRVDDDDLEFLVAFAGIGAVALDNIRFAERSRQEAVIRGNFERFFPPMLAARIAAAPETLRLGGERREVAVLFSDIRGFTTLAARLTPDETARVLTEYFSEMAECVFRHGGTLDKFIGDEVMAQWGAPLSEPDDTDRALDAAIAMMEALHRLNARWLSQGRPRLQVGIGINYGEAFAGFLGSVRRLEYTVIGDTVNTAKRLCSAAQGGEILVTDSVRDRLTNPRNLRPHEALPVSGRADPVTVYRVMP
ncbi:MAG TPA: adenylate/guanylate cyclase domain-containing protein [Gemmatimonadaceae bacterium]